MDRKKEYKIENLTMLQIQYLIELNKLEKKKGAVRMIAAKQEKFCFHLSKNHLWKKRSLQIRM